MLKVIDLYPRANDLKKKLQLFNVVFIDPGLGGTGMAAFNQLNHETPEPPGETLTIFKERGDWMSRAHSVAEEVERFFDRVLPCHVVVECPELWAGNDKSFAAMTNKRGKEPSSLSKLLYLVGLIGAEAYKWTNLPPLLMSPADWKGQLPKDVVDRRISKRWPELYPLPEAIGNHVSDAIGMGLAAQGGL